MSRRDDDNAGDNADAAAEQVGYGKPPSGTRFRKGQSGNPKGRPRKQPDEGTLLPAIHPTRTLLLAEAKRPITVRDGDRRYEIATTEGVVRALAKKAMQGGVLAARTWLAYQSAEDAREFAERNETFEFWRDYVAREKATIDAARRRGEALPEPLPHPDDIVLDYVNRDVKFEGPMDEKELGVAKWRLARAQLLYELMIFYGESEYGTPSEAEPVFGLYTLQYVIELADLGRLRHLSRGDEQAIERRMCGPRRAWEKHLAAECERLTIAFVPGRKSSRRIDLRDVGFAYVRGRIVPASSKRRRATVRA